MKQHILRAGLGLAAAMAAALIAPTVTGTAHDGVLLSARAEAEGRWRLDFEPGDFANVVTRTGKKDSAQYYLSYTVKNGGDEAREARLRIELRTETAKTYADRYDAAASRAYAKAKGLKMAPSSTFGLRKSPLAAGAKVAGLATFGSIDPNADKLQVRVYGLWDPIVKDDKGHVWAERRVLVLDYERRGDEYRRAEDTIMLKSKKSELEGERVRLKKPGAAED
jgi:hypothetical protein